jgi:ATP-dependent RNA helicase RhlE
MLTFRELNINKQLLSALEEMELTVPTVIQEKTFPIIMSGKDILGIAQTGTGKTLAFLLPLLRMWNFSKKRTPQIIVIVPTRELVAQIIEEVEKVSKYLNLVAVGVYGGANIRTQAEIISNGTDLIVGTPGRVIDLALNGDLILKDIKKIVIDEVDEMLALGFRPQLMQLLDVLPSKKQSLLFSATISPEIEAILEDYFINPVKVEAAPSGSPLTNIHEQFYKVPNFNTKINLLSSLLEKKEFRKSIIFTGSKKHADIIYEALSEKGIDSIGVLHSNKAQNTRFKLVNDFKENQLDFLLTTDLISRGIDISEVTYVFNFDIPDVVENYIHRIGRTGRANAKGQAISFVSPFELNLWEEICEYTKSQKDELIINGNIEISNVLTLEEQPVIQMKIPEIKIPKRENVGASFHEKKDKNKKVNVRKDWKKAKMDKYGKPKTRGQKKK